MKTRIAQTEKEIKKILDLRYAILRQPWNQPYETSSDGNEAACINVYVQNDDEEVLACGRLQENEPGVGQIRYMAVAKDQQGKGLGKLVLAALESAARSKNFSKIELQARENALDFYSGQGYHIREKSFKLWDIIQHYLMEKTL